MTDGYLHGRLAWELVPLAAATALVALVAAGPRIGGVAAAAGCLAVLLVSRVGEAGAVYPTAPASAFYPDVPVLDAIPRGKPDRIVALGPMLVPNAASVYGLEDVRGYESMTLLPLLQTYPLWSRSLGAWFNVVEDLGRPFLSFLNVRWAIAPHDTSPPPGMGRAEAHGRRRSAREHPRSPPRVRPDAPAVGPRARGAAEGARLDRRLLASAASSTEPAASGEWLANGDARVAIDRYEPQAMTLSVEAREPAVVATSVPAWKGWRILVDGKRVRAALLQPRLPGVPRAGGTPPRAAAVSSREFPAGMIVSLLDPAARPFPADPAGLLVRRARPRTGLPS